MLRKETGGISIESNFPNAIEDLATAITDRLESIDNREKRQEFLCRVLDRVVLDVDATQIGDSSTYGRRVVADIVDDLDL